MSDSGKKCDGFFIISPYEYFVREGEGVDVSKGGIGVSKLDNWPTFGAFGAENFEK